MAPWLQLLFIFAVSAVIMTLLRDTRIPLDGSSYALGVQRLAAGNVEDAFRWSHALHVPVLWSGYRLVSVLGHVDVLAYYQFLDILLGAGGLCLIYVLVLKVTQSVLASVMSCVLALFSWVYWIEAVTADEKMMGFFLVLIYLNLLQRFLGGEAQETRLPLGIQGAGLAVALSLSILMHASAVIVIPASLFLVIRRKAYRLGIWTTVLSVFLVMGIYLWILFQMGTKEWTEVTAYFSSGVTRYSIAATGISGLAWIRHVVQGLTKLIWAVFSEDGVKAGLLLAGLNFLFLAGLSWVMWLYRRDWRLQWFTVLFLTALVFGMTYAPEAPDSYFLLLVPMVVFFGKAMETNKFRYLGLGFLVVVIANNGFHYLQFSAFRDEAVDRRYQGAIGGHLSSGDALVVLDAEMGLVAGTQAIIPLHAYFNPDLEHVPSSEFFADPTAVRFQSLAREGRLYIEGLCFEDYDSRLAEEIQGKDSFLGLAEVYDLEPVLHFSEYSSLYHRSYKSVYRLSLISSR